MIEAQTYTSGPVPNTKVDGVITLSSDLRYRRRIRLTSDEGMSFLLNLPKTARLREGDILNLDNGQKIEVKAAQERVMAVRAENPIALMRLCWHIGNRHLDAEIRHDHILLLPDHVIENMLLQLRAEITHVNRPFNPEGGAYDAQSRHTHSHSHHE